MSKEPESTPPIYRLDAKVPVGKKEPNGKLPALVPFKKRSRLQRKEFYITNICMPNTWHSKHSTYIACTHVCMLSSLTKYRTLLASYNSNISDDIGVINMVS